MTPSPPPTRRLDVELPSARWGLMDWGVAGVVVGVLGVLTAVGVTDPGPMSPQFLVGPGAGSLMIWLGLVQSAQRMRQPVRGRLFEQSLALLVLGPLGIVVAVAAGLWPAAGYPAAAGLYAVFVLRVWRMAGLLRVAYATVGGQDSPAPTSPPRD